MAEKLLLKAQEVAELLSISHSKAYELIMLRQIPTVHIGRAVRVPMEGLRRYIAELEEQDRGR